MKNKNRMPIIAFIIGFMLTFLISVLSANGFEADTYIAEEYQAYCEKIGEMYCVCPELLMAMIETESSGNPDAMQNAENGVLSEYAAKILYRAEMLERIHGK